MNDGGLIGIILQNLPVLVVVIPLLLAPILPLLRRRAWPGRLAWLVLVALSGGNFIAINHRIDWPGDLSPWELGAAMGIEFVVDSATSLTLVIMTGLAFLATLYARASLCRKSSIQIWANVMRHGCWHLAGCSALLRQVMRLTCSYF